MMTDYVKGTMSILNKNLERLPLNKRPLHYIEGDEIFHIRTNNEWTTDTELNYKNRLDQRFCNDKSLYCALKHIDEGKIYHIGSNYYSDARYLTNYKKILQDVDNQGLKKQLLSEVMKLVTLDPNTIKSTA